MRIRGILCSGKTPEYNGKQAARIDSKNFAESYYCFAIVGGEDMPARKRRRLKVVLEPHALLKWHERARRSPGNLANLITALLNERLRTAYGVPVRNGRMMLLLDPELLDLPRPLIACIEMPDMYRICRVVTFRPVNKGMLAGNTGNSGCENNNPA